MLSRKDPPIEKQSLELFLGLVPELPQIAHDHSRLVAHFGYYLSEELAQAHVTPSRLQACYDAASIRSPSNMSYAMKKSGAFVRTNSGTTLARSARDRIASSLGKSNVRETARAVPTSLGSAEKLRTVVVVHGRDLKLRDSMFQFLRSVGLSPVEWNQAINKTGRTSPYVGEVVDALFQGAQAIVIIISPDEYAELRPELRSSHGVDDGGWQPRANVFVEAGMALSRDEAHTILVEIGNVRSASDLSGRHSVRLDNSSARRHDLLERLRIAGCAISSSGTDWLRTGQFVVRLRSSKIRRRR